MLIFMNHKNNKYTTHGELEYSLTTMYLFRKVNINPFNYIVQPELKRWIHRAMLLVWLYHLSN